MPCSRVESAIMARASPKFQSLRMIWSFRSTVLVVQPSLAAISSVVNPSIFQRAMARRMVSLMPSSKCWHSSAICKRDLGIGLPADQLPTSSPLPRRRSEDHRLGSTIRWPDPPRLTRRS